MDLPHVSFNTMKRGKGVDYLKYVWNEKLEILLGNLKISEICAEE
jgi:hypothetical protein